ncbi:MAG: hypothetical protein QM752_06435 [Gammaproteobacteria bacterium]
MLPHTTPKHYITGMTALNIPELEGSYGDWHFQEAFIGRRNLKPKIFLAGEGETWNTNPILADFGIYECSDILRQCGIEIPLNEKVYAANHYRAIIDMLYKSVKQKNYPYHLDLDSWTDNPKQKTLLTKLIRSLKPYVSSDEWQILKKWLLQQI